MILDENLNESKPEIKLSDQDIFTKIWTSPRLVFQYINDNNYDKFVTILLILAGITRAFDRAASKSMGDDMSLTVIIAFSIIAGALFGWITYYIYAALLSWTGKWLDGKGNTKSLLRMSAHAMIPSIVALVLMLPQIALFGKGIFESEIDVLSQGNIAAYIFYFTALLELVLGIWTLVIFVIGISVVQKFSIGKSILNLIIPILIILGPIFLIVFLINL